MSRATSLQLADELRSQLEAESQRIDAPVESLAAALLDEGLRMRRFAGIVFRDGPTGRRAGLANGPDVWEIIRDLQSATGDHAARVSQVRGEAALTGGAISLAEQYYESYPAEIDDRIERHYEFIEQMLEANEKERRAGADVESRAGDRGTSSRSGMSL